MADPVSLSSSVPEVRAKQATSAAATAELAGLAADSRTVAVWTLVSRITGFGRVVTVAAVLGPTYFGNLFQTSNAVPNLVHELLVGSLISGMLVPALVRNVDVRDRRGVGRLANGFLGTVVLAASVVVALCVVAAPLLLTFMTAAVAEPNVRHLQRQLGWPLLALLMPQVLLYGVAATGAAVQHAHRRFALAAAAPAFENIGTLAVMGASALIFGVGLDVHKVTTPQLILLGLGSTAAVGLHAAAQWWGAYRVGVPLVPRAGWRDPEVRRIVRLAIPSSGYAVLNSVTLLGLLVVAGAVPGGAVAFQIGYNFFNLPTALCARPVAAAQLPRLSRSFNQEMVAEFHSTYRSSLALATFIALPASLLFVCIPDTLARAVSFGEMATLAGTSLVAAAIGGLGAGIVGDAVLIVSTSASYARRDAVSPFQAMAIRAAVTFLGMAIALSTMRGAAILWTLGLSLSAANLVASAYLRWSQIRVLPPLPANKRYCLLGDMAASAIAVAPSVVIAGWVDGLIDDRYDGIVAGIAAIASSGLLYLIIQRARGSGELKSLFSDIPRQSPNGESSTPSPTEDRLERREESPG
jgi:putative peptidoglycan lipid II flippase